MKQRIIKVAKWLVGISFGIFLLVSILIYCYQDKICNFVLQEAGKTLEKPVFYSKVDLTFWQTFPNLSVNVYDAKIQDAYSHTRSNKTLLAAERISITLNPLDLWRENYHVQVIEISKGQLNIRTHADGDVNYLIFKPNATPNPLTKDYSILHTVNSGALASNALNIWGGGGLFYQTNVLNLLVTTNPIINIPDASSYLLGQEIRFYRDPLSPVANASCQLKVTTNCGGFIVSSTPGTSTFQLGNSGTGWFKVFFQCIMLSDNKYYWIQTQYM
jgi:hypothetical protein